MVERIKEMAGKAVAKGKQFYNDHETGIKEFGAFAVSAAVTGLVFGSGIRIGSEIEAQKANAWKAGVNNGLRSGMKYADSLSSSIVDKLRDEEDQ